MIIAAKRNICRRFVVSESFSDQSNPTCDSFNLDRFMLQYIKTFVLIEG
jgi:predicted P-loop ATPase/GTPase